MGSWMRRLLLLLRGRLLLVRLGSLIQSWRRLIAGFVLGLLI